ncbi:MAG: glycosyltransferase [Chitinophagaceae bacterium]|nr:glycosyltransferase [Chitinophagaceae bacterium]MBK7558175.1 glycosyltransferase [Chitinophagaceae bacterium]
MTKVVHIQYSMESAGRAALRQQKAFKHANVDSSIVSLQQSVQAVPGIKYLGLRARLLSRLDDRIQAYLTCKSIKEWGSFSYPVLGSNVAKLEEVKNADFIYIHWALKGLLNFRSIKQVAGLNKPVIIFLHDMWNITGGCHHSFTCEKYKTEGCNNCPVFPGDKKSDLSAKGFKKKLRVYAKFNNLYFVSPSRWLYDCAKASLLTKDKPVFYIPNILDNTLFKPADKTAAKQLLNIEAGETVLAFGAISVNSPYKGWTYLQKALELLKQDEPLKNISVLIFGSEYNKEIADSIPFKTRFMGYLKDEYSTALVYNAADVFIAPSLAEAFGYVVMEALSCGTPVVGFNVGGIPDLISHKENGYLAKYKDANDVSEGIKFCLQHKLKGYLLPGIDPAVTINSHLSLFEHIKKLNNQ